MVQHRNVHQNCGKGSKHQRLCPSQQPRRCQQLRISAEQSSSVSYTAAWTGNLLQRSAQLARHRAFESDAERPLFSDPFADTLAAQVEQQGLDAGHLAAEDVLSTWYVDQQILRGVALVNMELKEEYRQVVLVGDAMDTRPYRLPWPPGTVIYLVGPPEVHEFAEAVMQQQGAHVPRGCLLRRVRVDMQGWLNPGSGSRSALLPLQAPLERAGYRGDRLSVWGLQGYPVSQANPLTAMQQLLVEVTNNAAFSSIVVGQLPGISPQAADELLGSFALLGTASGCRGAVQNLAATLRSELPADAQDAVSDVEGLVSGLDDVWQQGRIDAWSRLRAAQGAASISKPLWQGNAVGESDNVGELENAAKVGESGNSQGRLGELGMRISQQERERVVLFSAQHKRLSLQQMQLREDHIAAAEDADEDFHGNFT